MQTYLGIVFIFLGELFLIIAELLASKFGFHSIASIVTSAALIILGGALLVAGYVFGYAGLKNIWIIAALSIGSIAIVEPVAMLLLFKEMPTTGALIGMTLGIVGVSVALLVP